MPKGFTFLGLVSNSVVMTSSKGSQILAPAEIEQGHERWAPTIPGINGVSPDGRWIVSASLDRTVVLSHQFWRREFGGAHWLYRYNYHNRRRNAIPAN